MRMAMSLLRSLELFRQVEPAYAAVTHLHAALEMRRTRARPGQTLGVIPEDGLDAVYDAAGSALDALGEEHREVWLSDIDRAVAGVVEDLMSEPPSDLETVFAAKYAQALLSAYRDIVNQGEELHLAVERVPPHNPVPSELQERIASWATRCIVWANDTNGPPLPRAAPDVPRRADRAVAAGSPRQHRDGQSQRPPGRARSDRAVTAITTPARSTGSMRTSDRGVFF